MYSQYGQKPDNQNLMSRNVTLYTWELIILIAITLWTLMMVPNTQSQPVIRKEI